MTRRWRDWLATGILCANLALGAGAAAANSGGGKEGKDEIPMIRLPVLIFPVLASGVVQRYLTVSVEIRLKSGEARARLGELQPRLVDAVFTRLYGKVTEQSLEGDLRNAITSIAATLIGDNNISTITVGMKQ